MPFSWKRLFPDISYLRIKRSKKNDRTQSTSGDIEGDASAPAAGSNTLVIQSTSRIVSNVAQTVLPGVAAVAGVIPVAGSPLKAAIGGLLFILQGIERNQQNKQGIDGLKRLLEQLGSYLDSAPNTTDPLELNRRNDLTKVLEETKFELEKNINGPIFTYTDRATQFIAGCSSNINTYLNLYSVSAQMQMFQMMQRMLTMVESNLLPGTYMLRCVTLVDATGDEHHIQMEYCHSFEQLSTVLGAIFKVESNLAQIQRRYLEAGQYNLSIDRNTEVTQLTNDYWPTIDPGTKIVMSIVKKQRQRRTDAYRCGGCETWNAVPSADKTQILLIDCGGCGRRFQVSTDSERGKEKQSVKITNKESLRIDTSATDIQLIRNWRLETEPPSYFIISDDEYLTPTDTDDSDSDVDLRRARCSMSNNDDIPEHQNSHVSDYEDVEDRSDADDGEDVEDSSDANDDGDVEDISDNDDNDAYDTTAPVTMLPATRM